MYVQCASLREVLRCKDGGLWNKRGPGAEITQDYRAKLRPEAEQA